TVIGIHLSHRLAGPILSFERFLDDVMHGKSRTLKLRRTDEFKQLEQVADRFYQQFHERLGIAATSLGVGEAAPAFVAATLTGGTVDIQQLLGSKIWLIFYRYATCPLCAVHLNDIKETVARARGAGVRVLAVYESRPQELDDLSHQATVRL